MKPSNVPKWADRFLQWYCRVDLLEEIQGDLYELFEEQVEQFGLIRARNAFTWNVMRSFRLSTIKKFSNKIWIMPFKSHFKIAYRQLWRQKYYTAVNILGLAIGFACVIFIACYVGRELSYDKLHPAKDQLYRLLTKEPSGIEESKGIYHNPPLAGLFVERFPEIKNGFRVRTTGSRLVQTEANPQNNYEQNLIYADQAMLDLFHYPLKYGDQQSALVKPFSVVLTEEKAEKYFGHSDPVGQKLFLNNNMQRPFTITGVVQQTKALSHLQYDFYLSMESLGAGALGNWRNSSYLTYFSVAAGTSISTLEAKLVDEVSQYRADFGQDGYRYELQPVRDIYLGSANVTAYGHWPTGDPQYLWLLASIALVILIVAIINFVNLSIARSANRSAEVGIRKVIGSSKGHLMGQFVLESVLQSLLALLMGLSLVFLFHSLHEKLFGTELWIPWSLSWFFMMTLGTGLMVGILAGLYPAFYLSNFSPLKSIQNQSNPQRKNRLQWGLVAFQVTASFVLIFSSILIYRQMQFIQSKDLGFDRAGILIVEDTYSLKDQTQSFNNQLEELVAIESVSESSYLPVDGYRLNGSTFQHPDSMAGSVEVELRRWYIDENYIPTLGMELVAGRNFASDRSLDSNTIILNETAVAMLGYENPIGQTLKLNRGSFNVVGVVKDFHFRSMKQDILALAFHKGDPQNSTSTVVRFKSDDYQELLAEVGEVWKAFAPQQPLRYHFLDDRFNQMYVSEKQTGLTFSTFAVLAVVIASLGLFVLTSFIVENRKKELSIRKLLGASIGNLFRLQTQIFGVILIIAILVGAPLAYYLMQNWLQDFAYHIQISWDIFVVTCILTLILMLISVFQQAMRMASANPVDALKE